MARSVDYRKGRGSKGVHTEDERLPLGKKDQGHDGATPPDDQKTTVATSENATTERSENMRRGLLAHATALFRLLPWLAPSRR